MIPVIFQIGPFPLNSFGLMMVCCFLTAWRRLVLSLERAGENSSIAEPMIVTAAVSGVVGSRINYILTNISEFYRHPFAVAFSGAGFVFYGGFIVAAISVIIFLRIHKKPFLQYADLASPALAVGYGVGRIGCHLSGDGDYGRVTDSWWGFSYLTGVVPTDPGLLVHPTPMYESLISLLLALFLVKLQEKSFFKFPGQLFALYLILSSVARFLVEFVRIEPRIYLSLTEAQLVAIGCISIGVVLFLVAAFSKR